MTRPGYIPRGNYAPPAPTELGASYTEEPGADDVVTVHDALLAVTGLSFDHIYAGSVTDVGAGSLTNLALENAASENQPTTGLVPGNGISEVALQFTDSSNDAAVGPDGAFLDFGAASRLVVCVFKTSLDITGADRSIWGKRDPLTPFAGVQAKLTAAGNAAVVQDGGAATNTRTLFAVHDDQAWHVLAYLDDNNAGQHDAETDLDGVAAAAQPAGSPNNSEPFAIGQLQIANNAAGMQVALFATADGPAIEGADLNALVTAVLAAMVA